MLGVPRPRLLLFNPCILRECANTLFHHGVVHVKTYHYQRTPSKNQLGSIQFDVDYSWRRSQLPCVSLCQFSCDTCCILVDGVHSHGVRLHIFQASATKMFFFAQHIICNILVASRRLVMHTCESHDEGMICFAMAFDPSCVCSPMPHTTVSSKSSNCRATSEVRICCCVFPPTVRSVMFRPCSRRKHLLLLFEPLRWAN